MSPSPKAIEGDFDYTKLTKEEEGIESVYYEEESFSPRKEETSFDFNNFQINKLPPKELTIVL